MEQFDEVQIIAHSASLYDVRKLAKQPLAALVVQNEDGTFSKRECHIFLLKLIGGVCDYFGAVFTAEQKIEMVQEMYNAGYFIKDAEWKLFVSRCKGLYYANRVEIKGQLYVAIFMQWFNLFLDEINEVNAIEAETRHRKNVEDGVLGANLRGFDTVDEMIQAFAKNAKIESEKVEEKKAINIEQVRAEQIEKLTASLPENEKVELINNQIHSIKRIFDAGEKVMLFTANGYEEVVFLEYTHLFNKTCTIQYYNTHIEEVEISNIQKQKK